MAFDATAVYASRNVYLYTAPYSATLDFPALGSAGYGTAWGATWVHPGYTRDGITVTMTVDRDEIMVDQELDPVLYPFSGRDIRMAGNMAEFTPANLSYAMSMGATTVVPPVGSTPGPAARGYNQWHLAGDPVDQFRAWGLDFQKNDDAEAIKAIIWKGQAQTNVESVFGVSNAAVQIPFEVRALPDTANVGLPRRVISIREYIPALP